jgi:hypothetical protein
VPTKFPQESGLQDKMVYSYLILSLSYLILSYLILSYRILPLSYLIVSYLIVSYRIVSYRIVSYRITSCRVRTLPSRIVSSPPRTVLVPPAVPCDDVSYRTVPCGVVSCRMQRRATTLEGCERTRLRSSWRRRTSTSVSSRTGSPHQCSTSGRRTKGAVGVRNEELPSFSIQRPKM